MDNQTMLTKYRNDLMEFTAWLEQLANDGKFMDLPSGVRTALFKGEKALKEDIKLYENLIGDSVKEDFLHFDDEDFLVDDIEIGVLEHA